MKAVNIPIGIPDVVARRAILSTNRRKLDPISADAGKDTRLSLPTIIREMCGTTNPIQPMTPLTETHVAVINVADMTMIVLIRRVRTPIVAAASSPSASKLSCHRSSRIITIPRRIGTAAKTRDFMRAEFKDPMSQYVIAGS